jgi:sugar lactone lactonase YvrE
LYIADGSNNQIRKVSPSGIISTAGGIAHCHLVETSEFSGDGGPATRAQFLNPQSTAVDAAGNLYIAEWGNSRVRRVDAAGTITTIAGNGEPGIGGRS